MIAVAVIALFGLAIAERVLLVGGYTILRDMITGARLIEELPRILVLPRSGVVVARRHLDGYKDERRRRGTHGHVYAPLAPGRA